LNLSIVLLDLADADARAASSRAHIGEARTLFQSLGPGATNLPGKAATDPEFREAYARQSTRLARR
jgi:hypothetical protein